MSALDWWAGLKQRFGTPYERALSVGERALAAEVFGDTLALDTVRLKSAWWVLKGYAVSPNGNIYYNKADWREDFSTGSLSERAWLIHELTHVWQVQQGVRVFWRALINRKYRYVLSAGKPFEHYGVEQQASIVADFYVARALGKDCSAFACLPFVALTTQHPPVQDSST